MMYETKCEMQFTFIGMLKMLIIVNHVREMLEKLYFFFAIFKIF